MNSKSEIRKRLLGLRNSLSNEEITAGSGEIVTGLKRMKEIRSASTLMVYLGFGSEVMTDDLIRWGWGEGKRIVVPFCHPEGREMTACRIDGFDELVEGRYGIRAPAAGRLRPVANGEIDAVIVPAVAFNRRGYRVGYGGGYYDRFLPAAPQAAKIGAAFACQIVEEIPVGPYDVKMDYIVTEKGILIAES
ncbi:MAG: 5-formyltetrahydrofolate cyclo-ligase [Deltaproteobacteria bacterium]|nr:5-formyltetrahydrofolate cyclo-ligase [Deltaproteobacteria bacterium]